jgi:predicted transporter
MEDALSASLTQQRLSALLTGSFAALALLLVAVGVYEASGWDGYESLSMQCFAKKARLISSANHFSTSGPGILIRG